ncbi:MAG TPA: TrkH family potassium uptake protein [bacterium]|nr:TrkH family potassium uptake protein [bacterium]
MNIPAVVSVLAAIVGIAVSFMILPLFVAILYGETLACHVFAWVMSGGLFLCGATYVAMRHLARYDKRPRGLSPRDGFVTVTLSWVFVSLFGALPFLFSGTIPSLADAYFETMSGFTTTGASILTDIESLPRSLLFWRALTQWLGGMGIVVLVVAVIPLLGIGGVQLLEAEAPGPSVDKVAPRIKDTAKLLWLLYLGFTVLETVLLWVGGMSPYDALTHTFTTLSTGGFSVRNASLGAYPGAYLQWVVTIFMLIGGTSFSIFFLLYRGRLGDIWRNSEWRAYLLIFLLTTLFIVVELSTRGIYDSFGDDVRHAAFQVASIMTTTGFATADFSLWPHFSQMVIFFLMFVGGCAGSTGGGIKVIRLVALFKLSVNEMRYLLHPRGVFTLTLDGRPVRKDLMYGIVGFFFLYVFFVLITTLVVATANYDLSTSLTTALATVGNIGPGLSLIGPMANYAHFPDYVVWCLSFAMMAGRLEIYTVFVIFSGLFWRR